MAAKVALMEGRINLCTIVCKASNVIHLFIFKLRKLIRSHLHVKSVRSTSAALSSESIRGTKYKVIHFGLGPICSETRNCDSCVTSNSDRRGGTKGERFKVY